MAGQQENTIFDNAAHIADLAKISPDMTIMPGGGNYERQSCRP